MIDALRDHLRLNAGFNGTPSLLCVAGTARTAGMTELRAHIALPLLPVITFEALGTPTADEMTRCWESPRGWQKMLTYHWVHTARHVYRMRPLVLLDGDIDPQYAIAACSAYRVRCRVAVVVDDTTPADLLEHARSLGCATIAAAGPPARVAAAIAGAAYELVTAQ